MGARMKVMHAFLDPEYKECIDGINAGKLDLKQACVSVPACKKAYQKIAESLPTDCEYPKDTNDPRVTLKQQMQDCDINLTT